MDQIKSRVVSGVTILDLGGKILYAPDADRLRKAVDDELKNGVKKILLNLAEVIYIDSAGMGAFTTCHAAVKKAGGKLKLLSITKKIHDLLVITILIDTFDNYYTENEAVASFK